jgi:formate hydrogenlyase subunit 3/multisubunit Na+/H+ antiporter MnhD subunit
MIKMGLYGLLRLLTFLGPPAAWWGPTLVGIGLASALFGIAMALHQRDLKRALAYSSIENIGLITLALGLGLWGLASKLPMVAALGMTAAFLHIWNHALMKGLLFFAAGSVLHGTGTRDIEQLGGLMQRMPWTGRAMMVGAVAIAALPPLNGFVGEWLMYLGLLQLGLGSAGDQSLPALLSVALLALIGGVAAIAFVRLAGVVLLGNPRSAAASLAHESSPWLLAPMLVLAILCFAAALFPGQMFGIISGAVDQALGRNPGVARAGVAESGVSLTTLGWVNVAILTGIALGGLLLTYLCHRHPDRPPAQGPTWGCGYVRPTERMQYTGRSFAELVSEHLIPRLVRPRVWKKAPEGLFPVPVTFRAEDRDPVTEMVYEPFFRRWARRFGRLHALQLGKINVYLVYVMATVVLALAWVSVRTWWTP